MNAPRNSAGSLRYFSYSQCRNKLKRHSLNRGRRARTAVFMTSISRTTRARPRTVGRGAPGGEPRPMISD